MKMSAMEVEDDPVDDVQAAPAPGSFGDLGEDDGPVPFRASDVLGTAHVDGLEKLHAPVMEGSGRGRRWEGSGGVWEEGKREETARV